MNVKELTSIKLAVRIRMCLSLLLCFAFVAGGVLSPARAWAAKDPGRVTFWNKITDTLATIGKDDNVKDTVKKRRREERRRSRVFKKRQKELKKTHKKMEKQNKIILDKINVRREAPVSR